MTVCLAPWSPSGATLGHDPERLAMAFAALEEREHFERTQDGIATARHEAGHAVLALATGFPVGFVSLEPNWLCREDGRCHVVAPPTLLHQRATSLRQRDALERYAIVLLGGAAADGLGRQPLAPDDAPDGSDLWRVGEVLQAWPEPLHPDERAALLAWWRQRAWHTLARHWPALLSIASELLWSPTRRLEGDAVRALYTAAVGPPAPVLDLTALYSLPHPPPLCHDQRD
jgi:hypothetical protein